MLKIQILFIRIAILLITFIGIFCPNSQAQTPVQSVRGKITESPSREPLPGVSVVEINANNRQINGTMTDATGNYQLRITDPKSRIRFSFIGSETITENINGRTVINASLKAAGSELTEVSIVSKKAEVASTGFTNISRRDMIGAVSSVKADLMSKEPATSIDQMIQGRVAGVQVVSNSGDPGAGVDIRIRGAGSISAGNDPLYIIDGIPIVSTPFDNTDAGRQSARINPIADINPNDIEKIDVLKDANAAAIYGSRAANGVIIITTKRGRVGVTNVTFSTQTSLLQAPPSIPVLNGSAYKVMRLEAEQNNGNINPTNTNNLPLVDDPSYSAYLYYQSNTDWLKELRRTGFGQVYNLSVNGGGESLKYNFGTSYTDQKGAMVNTGLQRFTGRFTLDYKVSDKMRFFANIAFARSKINTYAEYNNLGTVYYNALTRPTAMPNYDVDAFGNPQSSYFSLPGVTGSQDNPVAFANTVVNDAYSTTLRPNVSAEIDIIKGLKVRSNASLEFLGENGQTFLPPEATGLIWNDRSFNRNDTRDLERSQMIFDTYATYTRPITEKFRSTFLLGTTLNYFTKNELRTSAYATASGQLQTPGAAAGYNNLVSIPATETIVSLFTQANLVYNDKYGFNATVRQDGSSKFGYDNRFAYFPSVGGFWRISGEPFMKKATFITDLKVRGSWGQVGNQNIGNYAYISQYTAGRGYID
ncbi:MAG: SusC/RagA family TonB-linked outer membrane protein, partial [Sphingobacteriaceae bacterium]